MIDIKGYSGAGLERNMRRICDLTGPLIKRVITVVVILVLRCTITDSVCGGDWTNGCSYCIIGCACTITLYFYVLDDYARVRWEAYQPPYKVEVFGVGFSTPVRGNLFGTG
jgi:hypothetical protein